MLDLRNIFNQGNLFFRPLPMELLSGIERRFEENDETERNAFRFYYVNETEDFDWEKEYGIKENHNISIYHSQSFACGYNETIHMNTVIIRSFYDEIGFLNGKMR